MRIIFAPNSINTSTPFVSYKSGTSAKEKFWRRTFQNRRKVLVRCGFSKRKLLYSSTIIFVRKYEFVKSPYKTSEKYNINGFWATKILPSENLSISTKLRLVPMFLTLKLITTMYILSRKSVRLCFTNDCNDIWRFEWSSQNGRS